MTIRLLCVVTSTYYEHILHILLVSKHIFRTVLEKKKINLNILSKRMKSC
jgi:hypothetical protein